MCGIVGALGLGRDVPDSGRPVAAAMLEALRHRGPDQAGLHAEERAILGNARLRVIDLSPRSDLPMTGEDRKTWLAYNGMVTNFRELKERFALPAGCASDSEVVLRLYERLGPALVGELSGMFAFCVYDRARQKAFLVRDAHGLRPLFYAERDGVLYFASEIKALLEVPGLGGELDEEALWHFLTLAYIPGRMTPFLRIRELAGGRLLEVDLRTGAYSEKRHSRIDYRADESLDEDEAAAEVRRLLRGSVERNLVADVPVGLTLSGGVDTGSLLSLAKDLGASPRLHTFSLKMTEPSFDESRYQKVMVDYAKPIHHEIEIRPRDVVETLFASVAHLDEPSGNGAAVPTFILAREASRHVRVLLSGEGGDELFNAYETHRAYHARALYRGLVPSWARGAIRAAVSRLPVDHRKLSFDFLSKRFTEGAEKSVAKAHVFWRHALSDEEKGRLWRGRRGPATEDLFEELYRSLAFEDPLDRLSFLDLQYYFIDDLMVKNDRMLSAHSLEGRFPFMDRALVDFVSRTPSRFRLKGFSGRRLQKRAMRGLLPPEIASRQNMGLELPYSVWFYGELRELAERYFSPKAAARSGLLDGEAVQGLWREHLARRKDNGRALWCILNFQVWFELFVYEGSYKKHLVASERAPLSEGAWV
ncbi:MAG: asparagine synthase (glutamine-hydrolyzing) [Elusimicrobia bacterium]|nr:asparagine synthase (glutamine-hydrolyzing) [Elusimicrobiota bacterium]